jgi:hypothetical protein
MCGWPFVALAAAMQPIAAPVPSPARYAGSRAIAATSSARGGRLTTLEQSSATASAGWRELALGNELLPRASRDVAFAGSPAEPLLVDGSGRSQPARTIEALRSHAADVVAIDGFYLDLMRHYEPARLSGLVTLGSTPWSPIPLLCSGARHRTRGGREAAGVISSHPARARRLRAAPRRRAAHPLDAPDLPAYGHSSACARTPSAPGTRRSVDLAQFRSGP